MSPRLAVVTIICSVTCPGIGSAQLEMEQVRRTIELKRKAPFLKRPALFKLETFRDRYRFELEAFHRILPLDGAIRRCVEAQRPISGEFHTRLDFSIAPNGELKQFTVSSSLEQLHACLLPNALALRFPPFTGKPGFTLQVLVASPGVKLGRRVAAQPLAAYPVSSPEEEKAYRQTVGWVFSPWSMAISRCAEWVDQSMGFGYRLQLEITIDPSGKPHHATATLQGTQARKAMDQLLTCVTPFVRALRAPRHLGQQPVIFRSGTTTASFDPP